TLWHAARHSRRPLTQFITPKICRSCASPRIFASHSRLLAPVPNGHAHILTGLPRSTVAGRGVPVRRSPAWGAGHTPGWHAHHPRKVERYSAARPHHRGGIRNQRSHVDERGRKP